MCIWKEKILIRSLYGIENIKHHYWMHDEYVFTQINTTTDSEARHSPFIQPKHRTFIQNSSEASSHQSPFIWGIGESSYIYFHYS
jgi:hypothetical protein